MATVHIESKKEDIAETVLMPGDPLRAKYVADKYLDNVKLINKVRNNFGYTGFYKDKKVTVFSSGMGFPSMGIYAYELFTYYDVTNIIRIGTAGTNNIDVKVGDIVLGKDVATASNFAEVYDGTKDKIFKNSEDLNNQILATAQSLNTKVHYGMVMSNEVFDPYAKDNKIKELAPTDKYLANEMEAFALIFLANKLNKEATTLLTVSDASHDSNELTSEEREKNLDEMILLALESIVGL